MIAQLFRASTESGYQIDSAASVFVDLGNHIVYHDSEQIFFEVWQE